MNSPPDKSVLDALYEKHHHMENLWPDPLVFASGFEDPLDGEIAGLIAASLAYGRVDQIMNALETVFNVLGPNPRSALELRDPLCFLHALNGFIYRFHKGKDLALFFHLTAQCVKRRGSLKASFEIGDEANDIAFAMKAFSEDVFSGDPRPILSDAKLPDSHPVRYLLSSPANGGAAKRMCLFLRWMIRKDALDPGYWHGMIDSSRLIVPLDTHVARVGRELGFTKRASAGWKTALDITASLRRYDPLDPVRYDFSLFRYGMGKKIKPSIQNLKAEGKGLTPVQ